MLTNSRPYYCVDNDAPQELESNYFMSLHFNYLLLRYGNSFIIESHSPHRFGRQFRFYRNVPDFLENDIRSASQDEGLRFWRICTLYRSVSRAAFPPTGDPVEKPFSTNYLSWWEKAHGKFLENNLQALVDNVGLISTTPLGGEDQGVGKTLLKVKEPPTLIPKVRKLKSSKAALKDVVCTLTDIEKHPPVLPFSKQVPQDSSQSTNEDQNWKRKQPIPVEIVEFSSVDGPSRTHTVCNKEVKIPSPCPFFLFLIKRIASLKNYSLSLPFPYAVKCHWASGAVSTFEGKSIVFNRKKEFILGLWEDICNKLSKTHAESLSSYREQVIEIFEDMKKANILTLSPLECLLESLFELVASYDQERSNLADKTSQDEKLEQISKAKERLESFKLETSEKVKKVSSSDKKLKRVVKKLHTLQQERENLEGVIEVTQKEVEEI
ncbi:hypothetical protein A4A49_14670 [Nicotiana attenuata]|uniref:Aminotransferase-like plant mobile domain-containing protein n=1 Tax=Nicotiana attenuata TaxID=49451 RepID=A0A1J6IHU6_NICAT|nr:hypothetical protein A4A49_14670 [Nicotiana attenuata]